MIFAANAFGGSGGAFEVGYGADSAGVGGNGTAGSTTGDIAGVPLTGWNLSLIAEGYGGSGGFVGFGSEDAPPATPGAGGLGDGGRASLRIGAGGSVTATNIVDIRSSAYGGDGGFAQFVESGGAARRAAASHDWSRRRAGSSIPAPRGSARTPVAARSTAGRASAARPVRRRRATPRRSCAAAAVPASRR